MAPPPEFMPNGWALVCFEAFFSLSFIFFMKVFASFSSTNDSPARHGGLSSSKEWKNVRSWL
jgi:hypothetical protein